MRYRHYLPKAGGKRWPQNVLCVDCEGWFDGRNQSKGHEVEKLERWHVTVLVGERGEYRRVRNVTDDTAGGWWQWLDEQVRAHGPQWILSNRASRAWTLLRMWSKIDRGQVSITGRDPRENYDRDKVIAGLRAGQADPDAPLSAGAISRALERLDGYLVIEDPPNIAQLKLGTLSPWITWIDIGNYGVGPPDELLSGKATCDWLTEWIQDYSGLCHALKLGSLRNTAGSQAMHGFRHGYHDGGIICHNNQKALKLEGDCYYGGRCEAYRLGKSAELVWHLDFQAMYGSVMNDCLLPVRLAEYIDSPDPAECGKLAELCELCAEVDISTEDPVYPWRGEYDTFWPIGRFRTCLAGPELQRAVMSGAVRRWHRAARYELSRPLRDYAAALWAARKRYESEGRSELANVCKRLTVSLAGKLGQRSRRWMTVSKAGDGSRWGEWFGGDGDGNVCRYRAVGGIVQRDTDEGWSNDAVPAMAAWITSYARIRLWTAQVCAGRENVYYSDTDSLMVTERGYHNLIRAELVRADTMGRLTIKEGPGIVDVLGIKYYLESGKITCAGLPQGTAVDVGDGEHYWQYDTPKSYMRKGQEPDATRHLLAYNRAAPYRLGTVRDDGTVLPFVRGD